MGAPVSDLSAPRVPTSSSVEGLEPGPAHRRTWRERWVQWRNKLLMRASFQRWAAAFPLTRPMARRRARDLFDLCAGFIYSQVLLACVRVRLFDLLGEGPLSVAAIAPQIGMPLEPARRLVAAAASLDLLEALPDGRFALGALGAAARGTPGLAAMIDHHAMVYRDLSDPLPLLRDRAAHTTELETYWAYARSGQPASASDGAVAAYSALMAGTQPMIAEQVLAAFPEFGRHRVLMDVGGGEGAFLSVIGQAHPHLRLHLFDLPSVVERGRHSLAQAGLQGRTDTTGGSFFDDPLPAGADLISLIRILHDHDDDKALAILQAVRRAMPPEGTLLIAEPMAGTEAAEPIGDAYFGFYLLAMGSGRPRRWAELKAMLAQAGFDRARLHATHQPMLTRVATARPAPNPKSVPAN